MITHCCIIPLTLRGSWRPLSLMNERRIWSLHCPHVQIYIPEGGGQRERAVPISTVGLELSQTPRLNILSAWSSFLMWNRPREREREGDRGTRQDSRSGEGQKATLNHRVIHSLVFEESIYILIFSRQNPFLYCNNKMILKINMQTNPRAICRRCPPRLGPWERGKANAPEK